MEERQYHVTYNFIKRSNRKLPITRSVVFMPCNPLGVFSEASIQYCSCREVDAVSAKEYSG